MMPPNGQQPPTFIDPHNPLLGKVPVRLETGTVESPICQLGVVTIRTSSTTQISMLTPAELADWIRILTELKDSMSSSGLTVVRGSVIPPIHNQDRGVQR